MPLTRLGSLAAVLLLGFVLAPSLAQAQVGPGDRILTVGGGYVTGKSQITDDTIDGAAINLSYERLDWAKNTSFGFSIGYAAAEGDSGSSSSGVRATTNSIPFYLSGKYWLGQSKVQGFIGAGLGTYFTWATKEVDLTGESVSTSTRIGFGLGVPIGLSWSISESMLLTGNYTFNWLWSNELLKNDALHAFRLGLGFNLGV